MWKLGFLSCVAAELRLEEALLPGQGAVPKYNLGTRRNTFVYLIRSETLYQFHSQVLPLSGENA
jgi:hypothetical protein